MELSRCVGDMDLAEEQSHGFITRCTECSKAKAKYFLGGYEVDLQEPETRSAFPDVVECHTGELTAPTEGQDDGAKVGEDEIAAV